MSRAGPFALTALMAMVAVAAGLFFMEQGYPAVATELGQGLGRYETLLRGTPEADLLRGGPENEIISDSYVPDKARDRLYGGAGDDVLDGVSDPPLEDVLRCGADEDEAQADPEDDVGADCERVDIIDLSKEAKPPEGEPEYLPAPASG